LGVGYKEADNFVRIFISTFGTTDEVDCEFELEDEDTNETVKGHQKAPKMFKFYRMVAPKIDINNMLRQGIMKIERVWKTHSYDKRIFATVGLGMTSANVFFDSRNMNFKQVKWHEDEQECDRFLSILAKLSHELMHNNASHVASRSKTAAAARTHADGDTQPEVQLLHQLVGYSRNGYTAGYQRRCIVKGCTYKASFYCVECGVNTPVCGNGTGRVCQGKHQQDMNKGFASTTAHRTKRVKTEADTKAVKQEKLPSLRSVLDDV